MLNLSYIDRVEHPTRQKYVIQVWVSNAVLKIAFFIRLALDKKTKPLLLLFEGAVAAGGVEKPCGTKLWIVICKKKLGCHTIPEVRMELTNNGLLI